MCPWATRLTNYLILGQVGRAALGQILDVAVSLAKVADVDRTLGKEDVAVDGFQEGIKLLESLTLKSEEAGLEPRRLSVLAFLKSQLEEKQSEATASSVSS
ncbi:hypothetical protein Gotur_017931 [Gossypium turneri]